MGKAPIFPLALAARAAVSVRLAASLWGGFWVGLGLFSAFETAPGVFSSPRASAQLLGRSQTRGPARTQRNLAQNGHPI